MEFPKFVVPLCSFLFHPIPSNSALEGHPIRVGTFVRWIESSRWEKEFVVAPLHAWMLCSTGRRLRAFRVSRNNESGRRSCYQPSAPAPPTRLVFVDGRRNRLCTERRPLHEGGLVLRDELLDVHCVRAGELPDQIVCHLEDAVLEVRHDRLAVAFEMAVIAHAE